jgi:hypothetical protein
VSFTIWTPRALSSKAHDWRASAWRMVEAQHIASTMKIVDSLAEQDTLERLLDQHKPRLPDATQHLHYLLAAPFRYPSRRGGSRFRAQFDPGVFYGAETVRTAAAELGYWRWRFLQDAIDLKSLNPVAHTAFRVEVTTNAIDLQRSPFVKDEAAWTAPDDYSATQAFARVAREAEVGAIVYRSVRDIEPAWCAALLTSSAFAKLKPLHATQTWWLSVDRQTAHWRREAESHTFSMSRWISKAA